MNAKFSPVSLLAAVGAGGIAVLPFAFFNYVVPHGEGLVTYADIASHSWPFAQNILFWVLMGGMVIFALTHLFLVANFLPKYIRFFFSPVYHVNLEDPIKNTSLHTIFIMLAMTMNVLIGPIRFFIPLLSQNLQTLMLPALLFWILLLVLFVALQTNIFKRLFTNQVDLSKLGFGWLLDVFAMSMLAVTGSGIAALSKNAALAGTAAFLSFLLLTMAVFFAVIKVTLVFQKHFAEKSLPEKTFLPSFLNLVPAVTLLSITIFRLGHYFENNFGFPIDFLFTILLTGAFAFETWYLIFGLTVLYGYFRDEHFKKEHYPSQWGLICPFVAYGVLGTFTYDAFIQTPVIIILILLSFAISVSLFIHILIKHVGCQKGSIECEG